MQQYSKILEGRQKEADLKRYGTTRRDDLQAMGVSWEKAKKSMEIGRCPVSVLARRGGPKSKYM